VHAGASSRFEVLPMRAETLSMALSNDQCDCPCGFQSKLRTLRRRTEPTGEERCPRSRQARDCRTCGRLSA
jgi:hypothetical protein